MPLKITIRLFFFFLTSIICKSVFQAESGAVFTPLLDVLAPQHIALRKLSREQWGQSSHNNLFLTNALWSSSALKHGISQQLCLLLLSEPVCNGYQQCYLHISSLCSSPLSQKQRTSGDHKQLIMEAKQMFLFSWIQWVWFYGFVNPLHFYLFQLHTC